MWNSIQAVAGVIDDVQDPPHLRSEIHFGTSRAISQGKSSETLPGNDTEQVRAMYGLCKWQQMSWV